MDENSDAFLIHRLERTIVKLSKMLRCSTILTGVFDDDKSFYVVYHAGIEVDRFSSSPDGFEWLKKKHFRGDPASIESAFGWWKGGAELNRILNKKYRMESDRLLQIVRTFGISEDRAFTTIQDIENFQNQDVSSQVSLNAGNSEQIRDLKKYVKFNPI